MTELSAAIARLEPCPFCGNENVECNVRGGPMWVECPQCEATGPLAEMPNTAAAVWNRRAARVQAAEEPVTDEDMWLAMAAGYQSLGGRGNVAMIKTDQTTQFRVALTAFGLAIVRRKL